MKNTSEFFELFRGVMLAHLILLLHVLLVVCVGVLIVFFRGIVTHMSIILIVGLLLISGTVFYIFRRLKAQGKSLQGILNSPIFSGKSIEINLLGGMASIKIDSRGGDSTLPAIEPTAHSPQNEAQIPARIIELPEVARDIEHPVVDNRPIRKIFKWKN